MPPTLPQNFPDMFSTFHHLVVHSYVDAQNVGKGLSKEVAFRINRICVLIPALSLTVWGTLGK